MQFRVSLKSNNKIKNNNKGTLNNERAEINILLSEKGFY